MADQTFTPTRLIRHRGGVPVYQYRTDPHTPPLSVIRRPDQVRNQGRHIHDFPALWYRPRLARCTWLPPAKSLIRKRSATSRRSRGHLRSGRLRPGRTIAVADVADASTAVPVPARAVRRIAPAGVAESAATELELGHRVDRDRAGRSHDGYQQAALAHLTLLLIDLARLAGDVVGDLRRSGEPMLAEVFAVIDRRHGERLSLRDVAHEVGMTPGHLTTVVRPSHRPDCAGVDHRAPNGRSPESSTDTYFDRGVAEGRHT